MTTRVKVHFKRSKQCILHIPVTQIPSEIEHNIQTGMNILFENQNYSGTIKNFSKGN